MSRPASLLQVRLGTGRPRLGTRRLWALIVATVASVAAVAGPIAAAQAATYQVPSSIPSACSVDVTAAILSWVASVPDDSTLAFASGSCYRIEGTLELTRRHGLDFEGNGATFKSFDPPSDQRAMWRAWDSTNLVWHDMTLQGSYNAGGVFDASLQHAHAIDLRGTSATISGSSISNVAGDCVYFGLGATSALTRSSGSVLGSSCTGTGRNAVSVTAGDNILVYGVAANRIGYDVFDVEPNIGAGWGAQSVTFDHNTIGAYHGSAYSIVENAPISAQGFTNNTVAGRGLKISVGQSAIARQSYPVAGVTITGNIAAGAQVPSAMNLSLVTGLTVTGNSVALSGGTMAAVDSSCSVNVSGNSYPGGAQEVYTAPFSCGTTGGSSGGTTSGNGKQRKTLAVAVRAQAGRIGTAARRSAGRNARRHRARHAHRLRRHGAPRSARHPGAKRHLPSAHARRSQRRGAHHRRLRKSRHAASRNV